MYADHIKECNKFTQASAPNLLRAARFVLATIQQQLETTGRIVAEFESYGSASRFAFSNKARGLKWLATNSDELYRDAIHARGKPQKLLAVFLRVPGLGIVKAGFLAQIFDNAVGCIDLHNVTLYGVPASALRYEKKLKARTRRAKRAQYVALCKGLGGSVALWSRWCDHVAKIRPANWGDGREVSQYHVDVITGCERGAMADLFTHDERPAFNRAA